MAQPRRYQVLGALSAGGAGRSALGLALGTGKPQPVVCVWIPESVADDAERYADLVRDTELAARLFHPCILQVHGLETVDGKLARVVAFADGEPLAKVLEAGGRLPPALAARVMADACAGVHFAHGKGEQGQPLVHGALSAATLLVCHSGITQVTGYGAGVAFGGQAAHPAFVPSPEQLVSGPDSASRESDVYLLGQVLYECLAGEGPFARELDRRKAAVTKLPPPLEPLGIPGPLAAVAARALAKKREERFPDAEALGQAIAAAVGPLPDRNAMSAYMDMIFPADQGDRAARRATLERAVRELAAVAPASPAATPPPVAFPPAAPRALTPPPLAPAPAAPARQPMAPKPADQVDLITTAEIIVPHAPARPPVVPELITTAEIIVPVAKPPPAPDLITTAEIIVSTNPSDERDHRATAPYFPKFSDAPRTASPAPVRSPPPAPPEPWWLQRTAVRVAGGVVFALAGFATGYGFSGIGVQDLPPPPAVAATATPAAPAPAAVAPPAPRPAAAAPPAPVVRPPDASPPAAAAAPAKPLPAHASAPAKPSAPARPEKPKPAPAKPPPARPKPSETAAAFPAPGGKKDVPMGMIHVRAPDEVKVFMDGKYVGSGSVHKKFPAGPHTVMVTLGESKTGEDFTLEPNGSYTYEVTGYQ